jgi:hypothetical protein
MAVCGRSVGAALLAINQPRRATFTPVAKVSRRNWFGNLGAGRNSGQPCQAHSAFGIADGVAVVGSVVSNVGVARKPAAAHH